MMDMGVASPNAQGQAIINTATIFIWANSKRGSGPQITQLEVGCCYNT